MFIGRLNMMPDTGVAQEMDDLTYGERASTFPNEHDFLVALPLIERFSAQLFRHEFNAAHAAHRVAGGILCIPNGPIFHRFVLQASPLLKLEVRRVQPLVQPHSRRPGTAPQSPASNPVAATHKAASPKSAPRPPQSDARSRPHRHSR